MNQEERTGYANQLRENPLFIELMEKIEAKVKSLEDQHWEKPTTKEAVFESFRSAKTNKVWLKWIKSQLRELKIRD